MTWLFLFLISRSLTVEVQLNQKPVSGQKVEFYQFKEGRPFSPKYKTTNSRGRVQFTVPKGEADFILRTKFEGVSYFTDFLTYQEIPKEPVLLNVYPTKVMEDSVYLSEVQLFFWLDERGLRVEEELVLKNPSKFTVTGVSGARGKEVFRFSIPAKAFNVQFGSGFDQKDTRLEENDIVDSKPLRPGESRFSLAYYLERSHQTSLSFEQHYTYPVKKIFVATNDPDLEFHGLALKEGPEKYYRGALSPTFESPDLNQKKIRFSIKGLPFYFNWLAYLPWAGVLLLCTMALLLNQRPLKVATTSEPPSALKDLQTLERLKKQKVLSEEEFRSQRMQILEKLIPFYARSSQNKS